MVAISTNAIQKAMAIAVAKAVNEESKELLDAHKAGGILRDDWLDINEQSARLAAMDKLESEDYGDRPDANRVQVIIKARRKADKVIETYTFNEAIPFYFSRYIRYWSAVRWDMVVCYTNSELGPKSYTAAEAKAAANPIRRRRNREHEQAYIVLHEESTVTCEDTGISFTCRLPIPVGSQAARSVNLAIKHPLAKFETVQAVLRQYFKTGIRIERELESQVLAGMLLTILRHKNLLNCKDAPAANMFLQAATRQTLSYAVRYFHNLSSTIGMPAISTALADLDTIKNVLRHTGLSTLQKAQQQAELFVLNYIKTCSGENATDETSHIKPTKQVGKVKVYTDPTAQQHKVVKDKAVEASELLAALVKLQNGSATNHALLAVVKTNIKMLAFLSPKMRGDIASKLVAAFPGNVEAVKLSQIFTDIATDKIADDLLSFSQEHTMSKQAASSAQKVKVDFLSMLNTKS